MGEKGKGKREKGKGKREKGKGKREKSKAAEWFNNYNVWLTRLDSFKIISLNLVDANELATTLTRRINRVYQCPSSAKNYSPAFWNDSQWHLSWNFKKKSIDDDITDVLNH